MLGRACRGVTRSGVHRVISFAREVVSLQVGDLERLHLLVGDLDALLVGVGVEHRLDPQPGLAGGRGDRRGHHRGGPAGPHSGDGGDVRGRDRADRAGHAGHGQSRHRPAPLPGGSRDRLGRVPRAGPCQLRAVDEGVGAGWSPRWGGRRRCVGGVVVGEHGVAREDALHVVGDQLPASYNVAPTQPVRVVLVRAPRDAPGTTPVRQLRTARWGLVPSWSRDPKIGSRLINARMETITEKPSLKAGAVFDGDRSGGHD
jgi:SOS response associated peptidase (SRAP)